MRILVTGGCGFIGAHFIEAIRKDHRVDLVANYDCLTYAGKPPRELPKVIFHKANIRDLNKLKSVLRNAAITHIVHLAAETHVDNSISKPDDFSKTNVMGTHNLLEAVRDVRRHIKRIVYVSTDEVYGSCPEGCEFTEESLVRPSSPYSASKAAGEMLCMAYRRTWGLPIIITRGTNTYGTGQYREKLIPKAVYCIMHHLAFPIYGHGGQVRDWMHVDDHVNGLLTVLERGVDGEIYNIAALHPASNNSILNEIAYVILKQLGGPKATFVNVKDRLGHDERYAVSNDKILKLGWKPGEWRLAEVVKSLSGL